MCSFGYLKLCFVCLFLQLRYILVCSAVPVLAAGFWREQEGSFLEKKKRYFKCSF